MTTGLGCIALSMIQEKGDQFDLVMANVNMPDMDSFSFLHVLLKMNIVVICKLNFALLSHLISKLNFALLSHPIKCLHYCPAI